MLISREEKTLERRGTKEKPKSSTTVAPSDDFKFDDENDREPGDVVGFLKWSHAAASTTSHYHRYG